MHCKNGSQEPITGRLFAKCWIQLLQVDIFHFVFCVLCISQTSSDFICICKKYEKVPGANQWASFCQLDCGYNFCKWISSILYFVFPKLLVILFVFVRNYDKVPGANHWLSFCHVDITFASIHLPFCTFQTSLICICIFKKI